MLFDRHLVRDVAFAVLLGLPTLALARPEAPAPRPEAISTATPLPEQAALADRTATDRRFQVPEKA